MAHANHSRLQKRSDKCAGRDHETIAATDIIASSYKSRVPYLNAEQLQA